MGFVNGIICLSKQRTISLCPSVNCPYLLCVCDLRMWVFCFSFSPPSPPQSLCQVLDASLSMGSRVLETQLDSLLLALHQQVLHPLTTHFKCHNPDYATAIQWTPIAKALAELSHPNA